jgi:hypothetical protein
VRAVEDRGVSETMMALKLKDPVNRITEIRSVDCPIICKIIKMALLAFQVLPLISRKQLVSTQTLIRSVRAAKSPG